MGRRTLLLGLAAIVALASTAGVQARKPPGYVGPKPNIIVLMVDDLAQMDDRVWSRLPRIKTMFIRYGVRFTDSIGQDPLCCPGRANFLTGQTADHHGVTTNDATLFDPRESLATELQGAGYWTAIVGKYFNGMEALADKTPPGWNKSLIYSGGYTGTTMWRQGIEAHPSGYSTDYIADQAVKFLQNAPLTKPVFMFLTPYAVHSVSSSGPSAYQPKGAPADVGDPRCADTPSWKPSGYNEADVSDKPAWVQDRPTTLYPGGWPLVTSCEALLSVDRMLDRVRAELVAQGRDNVLYVLTADNGMSFNRHRWPAKNAPYAAPIPLFFRATGNVTIGTTPRSETATVSNMDLAPTLCALAGCTMGPFPDGDPVDGTSFLSVLTDQQASIARDWLYLQDRGAGAILPSWHGVRSTDGNTIGRWEYQEYTTGECELYDLDADPWELENRCNDPAVAAQQGAASAALAAFRMEPKDSVQSCTAIEHQSGVRPSRSQRE